MTKTHLQLDHCYMFDPGYTVLSSLMKSGFYCDWGKMYEHPNQMYCRFLYFYAPISEGKLEYKTYLEFIDCPDWSKTRLPKSGIGFKTPRSLFEIWQQWRGRLEPLGAKFVHKNYDWKADSKSIKPGWNFINFKNSPLGDDLDLFFISYDERPGVEKKTIEIQHPNLNNQLLSVKIPSPQFEKLNQLLNDLEVDLDPCTIQRGSRLEALFSDQVVPLYHNDS